MRIWTQTPLKHCRGGRKNRMSHLGHGWGEFLLFATEFLAVVRYRCYFPPFFFWFPPFFSSQRCFSLLFPTCLYSIFSFSNSNFVFSESFFHSFLEFEIKFENELGELPPPLIPNRPFTSQFLCFQSPHIFYLPRNATMTTIWC